MKKLFPAMTNLYIRLAKALHPALPRLLCSEHRSSKKMFKSVLCLSVAAILTAGCGASPIAVSPAEVSAQQALLAIRTDVKGGLRYQRTILGTDELKAGLSSDGLAVVAQHYRDIAQKVISRSRPVANLKGYGEQMDQVLKYDLSMISTRRPPLAALTAVVGEYHETFDAIAADTSARLGRSAPPPADDDLVWNPRVGK